MRVPQRCLERFPVTRGPLDLTVFLPSSSALPHRDDVELVLSEEQLCELIGRYVDCEVLLLSRWAARMPDSVLRCIGLAMGQTLLDLDLSYSSVSSAELAVLCPLLFCLQSVRLSGCARVCSAACSVLAKTCHASLSLLYMDNCPLVRHDAALYLSGAVGAAGLTGLTMLDLAVCPLEDRSMAALALCMTRLRHLNLRANTALSDAGLLPLVRANRRLELLNLSGCSLITSAVLVELGHCCTRLLSLNISMCVLVTDAGVCALAIGCRKLQAVNLAGIRNLTEVGLCGLAESCPNLLMLNVTGCDQVALSGVRALVSGLHCVEEAHSFVGFKPVDQHVERKLLRQLHMLHEAAALSIQRASKTMTRKRTVIAQYQAERLHRAARLLTRVIRAYGKRMHFYFRLRRKVSFKCALLIQRLVRGARGRRAARERALVVAECRRLFPLARLLQRWVRGHLVRMRCARVYERIAMLYRRRAVDATNAVVVILQRTVRRFVVRRRISAYKELVQRGRMNLTHAATLIQSHARRRIAMKTVAGLRELRARYLYVLDRASRRLQKWLRDCVVRIRAKRERELRRTMRIRQWAAASVMQRVYRGHVGRTLVQRRRIIDATRWFAATLIQKVFRGSLVLPWRDVRLNKMASFVFDRYRHERALRQRDCSRRYARFVVDCRVDSCSEEDEDEEETSDWTETRHGQSGARCWFNASTKERTFVEPFSSRVADESYVGLRVRVLWLVQQQWFGGRVVRFNARKRKYRVEYDDGDHEWVSFDRDAARVQIWQDVVAEEGQWEEGEEGEGEGTWVMHQLYMSSAQRVEAERRVMRVQERQAREAAFVDVRQWAVLSDDAGTGRVLFMCGETGELRTGVPDALLWEVRADEMGYPVFVHAESGVVSYEDPRFTYDVTSDVLAQREFVMQELRFTVYFAKELYDKYVAAVAESSARAVTRALRNIRESDKPKQLSALVLRAKALFKQSSIADRAMDPRTQSELEYAEQLSEALGTLMSEATFRGIAEVQAKRDHIEDLRRKYDRALVCHHCGHEVKRQHEFCPTCGKKQIF